MAKLFIGIRSITVGEDFCWLVSRTFCFQFHGAFVVHLPPHQFGVAINGGYEGMVHGIQVTLDVHLNWVVLQVDITNVFNIVSRRVIFQELHVTSGQLFQLILFVHFFYVPQLPLLFNHHSFQGDLYII